MPEMHQKQEADDSRASRAWPRSKAYEVNWAHSETKNCMSCVKKRLLLASFGLVFFSRKPSIGKVLAAKKKVIFGNTETALAVTSVLIAYAHKYLFSWHYLAFFCSRAHVFYLRSLVVDYKEKRSKAKKLFSHQQTLHDFRRPTADKPLIFPLLSH